MSPKNKKKLGLNKDKTR